MRQNKYLQTLLYNWPAKILSLVFALVVFAFIQYTNLDTRIVTIPLEVTLPTVLEPQSLVPTRVDVKIKGNEDIIYLIDVTSISATANFSDVRSEGIATRAVSLVYEKQIFDSAQISLVADPEQFRILFALPEEP
jgi:hypothetical protein